MDDLPEWKALQERLSELRKSLERAQSFEEIFNLEDEEAFEEFMDKVTGGQR